MKKIIICIIMMLCLGVNNSSSQTIVREGKVFKSKGNNKSTPEKDTLVTSFKWEASGIQYPIIINKNSGSCYIWKKRKDGTVYPMYMKSEVSQQVAKEYNIEYKPRNRR